MRNNWEGQRIGNLTIIVDTGKRLHRSIVWECECDCGQVCEKPSNYIRDTLSSGGIPKCDYCSIKDFDITGRTFGSLVALRPIGKRHGDNRAGALWEFQCQCGQLVRKLARDVRRQAKDGFVPCCGKRECGAITGRLPDGEAARNALISSYKKGAKKRGLRFSLTTKELVQLFQGNCHYCNQPPEQVRKSRYKTHSASYIYNGIDRVNNKKGYVSDNVVSCCEKCNKAKRNMSRDEFLDWVSQVANWSLS